MSGSATLGASLVDDLVADIDELRGELHADFGVRPFRVYTVLRSWTGEQEGEGSHFDVISEITPQPRVGFWDGYKFALTPLGTHEDGEVQISEVSLTYTYDELSGGTLGLNQQWFYVLVDAHGQGCPDRYLRINRPPFPDREKNIGWEVRLMDMNLPRDTAPLLPGAE